MVSHLADLFLISSIPIHPPFKVQIGQVEAEELGAAAGYEAFRQWSAYGTTYRGSLGGGADREVEALAGIAAGEVRRLVASSFGGRSAQELFRRSQMRSDILEQD